MSLREVHIEHARLDFTWQPEAVRRLARALFDSRRTLDSLTLTVCELGYGGAAVVCDSLATAPTRTQLQCLDLSLNGLAMPGARSIAKVLPHLPALRALRLSSNALGVDGARELASGLRVVAATLQELDVAENGLGPSGVGFFCECGLQLQTLIVGRNWLKAEEGGVLVSLLSPMAGTLTRLDIAGNKLEAAGMRALLEQLPPLPSLTALDLTQCQFGTAAFAGGSPCRRLRDVFPGLEDLNLAACRLGSDLDALLALVAGLPLTLRRLSLATSDMHLPVLSRLLEDIPLLPSLEAVSLVQSRLDDAAVEALAVPAHLAKLPGLQTLDISGNAVNRSAAVRLETVLRECCPQFRTLRGMRSR